MGSGKEIREGDEHMKIGVEDLPVINAIQKLR